MHLLGSVCATNQVIFAGASLKSSDLMVDVRELRVSPPPLMNPLLIYSHSYSSLNVSFSRPWGSWTPCGLHTINRKKEMFGRPFTSPCAGFTSEMTVEHIESHKLYCPLSCLPLSFTWFLSGHITYTIPPCSLTYPLIFNFTVKSLRAAWAWRQMLPVEMRIFFFSMASVIRRSYIFISIKM